MPPGGASVVSTLFPWVFKREFAMQGVNPCPGFSDVNYRIGHNTITEQTIDVLSFNADKANLTRIGAGYDREFTFVALS